MHLELERSLVRAGRRCRPARAGLPFRARRAPRVSALPGRLLSRTLSLHARARRHLLSFTFPRAFKAVALGVGLRQVIESTDSRIALLPSMNLQRSAPIFVLLNLSECRSAHTRSAPFAGIVKSRPYVKHEVGRAAATSRRWNAVCGAGKSFASPGPARPPWSLPSPLPFVSLSHCWSRNVSGGRIERATAASCGWSPHWQLPSRRLTRPSVRQQRHLRRLRRDDGSSLPYFCRGWVRHPC